MGAESPLGEAAWGLHVGIFVVWGPAVYLAKRLCGNVGQKEYWATVLRGCPTWMKHLTYALFGYAMINFVLFAARAAGGHENTVIALRGFSGHWMAFYCAAMAIHVSYLNRAS